MTGKERKLKIVPKHFPRTWKDAVFPEIRLAGKWLQDLGFKCGNFVIITQGESTITITALPEVQAEPQPAKINARKARPIFSPELDALPGDQLFSVLTAEEYRAYLSRKKDGGKNIDDQEKEQVQNIIQLVPEVQQLPGPDDRIIIMHPEPRHAADGPDFFTIA